MRSLAPGSLRTVFLWRSANIVNPLKLKLPFSFVKYTLIVLLSSRYDTVKILVSMPMQLLDCSSIMVWHPASEE